MVPILRVGRLLEPDQLPRNISISLLSMLVMQARGQITGRVTLSTWLTWVAISQVHGSLKILQSWACTYSRATSKWLLYSSAMFCIIMSPIWVCLWQTVMCIWCVLTPRQSLQSPINAVVFYKPQVSARLHSEPKILRPYTILQVYYKRFY